MTRIVQVGGALRVIAVAQQGPAGADGGGGMEIGGTIVGGSPNRILYSNAASELASDQYFTRGAGPQYKTNFSSFLPAQFVDDNGMTFTADNVGAVGNTILLQGVAGQTGQDAADVWNAANPSNTATVTNNQTFEFDGEIQLTGGGTFSFSDEYTGLRFSGMKFSTGDSNVYANGFFAFDNPVPFMFAGDFEGAGASYLFCDKENLQLQNFGNVDGDFWLNSIQANGGSLNLTRTQGGDDYSLSLNSNGIQIGVPDGNYTWPQTMPEADDLVFSVGTDGVITLVPGGGATEFLQLLRNESDISYIGASGSGTDSDRQAIGFESTSDGSSGLIENIFFKTNGLERARVTLDGDWGFGTNSPFARAHFYKEDLLDQDFTVGFFQTNSVNATAPLTTGIHTALRADFNLDDYFGRTGDARTAAIQANGLVNMPIGGQEIEHFGGVRSVVRNLNGVINNAFGIESLVVSQCGFYNPYTVGVFSDLLQEGQANVGDFIGFYSRVRTTNTTSDGLIVDAVGYLSDILSATDDEVITNGINFHAKTNQSDNAFAFVNDTAAANNYFKNETYFAGSGKANPDTIIDDTGKIRFYKSLTTTGMGVAPVVGYGKLENQTAGNIITLTTGGVSSVGNKGRYRVDVFFQVTTLFDSGTAEIKVNYQSAANGGNIQQQLIFDFPLDAPLGYTVFSQSVPIELDENTQPNVAVNLIDPVGSGEYFLSASISKISEWTT
jgi:hypothetical protein